MKLRESTWGARFTSGGGGLRGWALFFLLLFLTDVCPVHICQDLQGINRIYYLLQPQVSSYQTRGPRVDHVDGVAKENRGGGEKEEEKEHTSWEWKFRKREGRKGRKLLAEISWQEKTGKSSAPCTRRFSSTFAFSRSWESRFQIDSVPKCKLDAHKYCG